ncbi:sodium/glutamate symporter [Psychrobacillus psychrodurans]|uniref:sodium/glutamate symporter n=1 Tax=Psychrobacillus psychrodurans TaxID=126157 RepID=UPI0008EF945E|nr:sodium/glutamate symporter [Psychrobacillus psychrodurans]MCZ8541062.1 sodium/glutamate symporter [Psychrobacillus psychrodurans]SFM83647.1 glutamate:Na+ symporter, ESS family [Psychrobacillus psychrodurans]
MIELNQITTLFLAVALYLFGMALVNRIGLLNRFLIPAPVVGGLIFATLALVLKTTGIVEVSLDTSLQTLFMIAFFTTVGLGASFKLIKLGGKLLVIYLLLCGVTVFLQNVIGVSFAGLFGIDPLLGVMAGAVSMNGGHGGAAAYGQTIEDLGISSALTIGMAAATLGLICGSLSGGPVARYLIKKHDLKPATGKIEGYVEKDERPIQEWSFMVQVALITFSMAVGTYLGDLFTNVTGFVLPSYIGAMFVAVMVRNLADHFIKGTVNMKEINLIGDVSLAIFLSMALMSIKLWEVADLALPLIGIILIQVIVVVLYALFVMFPLLGKDYDAAVMISGFLGHGLGATPNAMANMSATVSKYGPSRTAFLVVPIVGAFLIDVVFSAPIIITTINLFK